MAEGNFYKDKTVSGGYKSHCIECAKNEARKRAKPVLDIHPDAEPWDYDVNHLYHIDMHSMNIEARQTAYRKISKMKRALHETTA